MKTLMAYLRLIRYTNLIIIILSQYFFRHFIILPLYNLESVIPPTSDLFFFLLVLSTVLIAAGGYAINDYFDMRVDRINKPDKMLLGRIIPRRMAILIHGVFTGVGILCSLIAAIMIGSWKLGLISVVIAYTLWQYSHKFKATFITGNVIIALTSSFVVFIVWLFEFYAEMNTGHALLREGQFLTYFMLAYIIFAFLVSLIREIIKDIEDIEGDNRVGCRTIPITLGIPNTKIVVTVLVAISIFFTLAIVYFLVPLVNFRLLLYYMAIIAAFFVYLLIIIRKADTKQDYSFMSLFVKIIMITGLLSMQLIYILL